MVHQLINEHEKVQTGLEVMVNDIRVDYMRLPNELSYVFIVLVGPYGPTVTEADAAIEEVTNAMMSQSYDHGSEWRIKNRETDTFSSSQNLRSLGSTYPIPSGNSTIARTKLITPPGAPPIIGLGSTGLE